LHYRLGWVASPGALPRERFSSVAPSGHSNYSAAIRPGALLRDAILRLTMSM
jgi:hypothetical protein